MKVNAKALYLILGLLIGLGALAALRTIGNENNAVQPACRTPSSCFYTS